MKKLLLFFLLIVNSCIFIANPSHGESVHIIPERFSGKDRYDTSIAISQKSFTQADNVILVNGTKYIDALSSPLLSRHLYAPILLTRTDTITPELMKELKRLKAKNIYIIGGNSCISENTEKELAKNYSITRFAGKNRYETSIATAIKGLSFRKDYKVVIANGSNPEEVAIAGQYSYLMDIPVILVKKDEIPKEVLEWIKYRSIDEAHIIGNENSISKTIEKNFRKTERVFGNDIFELSAASVRKAGSLSGGYTLVNIENIVDHIPAMGLQFLKPYPIVFVKKDHFPAPIEKLLTDHKVDNLSLIGGQKTLGFNEVTLEPNYTTLKSVLHSYGLRKDTALVRADKDVSSYQATFGISDYTYIKGKTKIAKALDFPDAHIVEETRTKEIPIEEYSGYKDGWNLILSFERDNGKYVDLKINFANVRLEIQEDDISIDYILSKGSYPIIKQYAEEMMSYID